MAIGRRQDAGAAAGRGTRSRWLVLSAGYRGDPLRNYLAWIRPAGVEPVVLRPGEPEPPGARDCAALLLTGGGDVDPARYGAERHPRTASVNPARDAMELDWIRRFREAGRPIFGICRGIQILQVACGGGLLQHVPDALAGIGPSPEAHSGPDGTDPRHGVEWVAGATLSGECGAAREVNSHQAADPARPAPGLRVAARSPGGIVEALEASDGSPVYGVQWHPERMADPEHPASGGLLAFWLRVAGTP